MIKIGKRQELKVNNISSIGVYLDAMTEESKDNILLPNNELDDMEVEVGDTLNVFIYRDSEDRLIATLKEVKAIIGTIAALEVVDTSDIGSFLDYGLSRDLFLPADQHNRTLKVGEEALVGLYEDKKGRLTATTNLYKFLLPTFSYEAGDWVHGTIYRINEEIGAFVAVEDRYFGLVPNSEIFNQLKVGDKARFRVMRVREDGKLDLSTRELLIQQMDQNSLKILNFLKDTKKPLNDKLSPDEVRRTFAMSKKDFKRAIGQLYKKQNIKKNEEGLFILNTDK